jgi:hypothetical protein
MLEREPDKSGGNVHFSVLICHRGLLLLHVEQTDTDEEGNLHFSAVTCHWEACYCYILRTETDEEWRLCSL